METGGSLVIHTLPPYAGDMTTHLRPDLLELSVAERIQLAQDLWDSIPEEDVPDLSEAQWQEVMRRVEEHEQDPTSAIPLEEALDDIERSLR